MVGSLTNLIILRKSSPNIDNTTSQYLQALSVTDILYLVFMIGYLVRLSVDFKFWNASCCSGSWASSRQWTGTVMAGCTTWPTGAWSSPTPSSPPPPGSSCSSPSTTSRISTIRILQSQSRTVCRQREVGGCQYIWWRRRLSPTFRDQWSRQWSYYRILQLKGCWVTRMQH